MKEAILSYLSAGYSERGSLHYYQTLDSTNTEAKALARQGAPAGTAVVAQMQTGGRGRMGRSFLSPAGGVYLSVILRPEMPAAELMHLTCAAAVAAQQAVREVTGIVPQIKWINDLVLEEKKLGGILTELSLKPDGSVDFAIIGIGINCGAVPAEVAQIATAVDADPAQLCAELINAFCQMDLQSKTSMLEHYRASCITLGKPVKILGSETTGTAVDVDDRGGLMIRLETGDIRTVDSGEVSVRGLYGYV